MRFLITAIALFAASNCNADSLVIESAVVKIHDEAELAMQQAGLLTELAIGEGDQVNRGNLLAKIDSRQAELLVQKAAAELSLARAEAGNDVALRYASKAHQVAAAELARSEESIAKHARAVSQSQIDVERLETQKLELDIEQAEHEQDLQRLRMRAKEVELRAAEVALAQRRLESPLRGMVVEVRRSVGEWVESGEVVVRLVGIDRVRVEGMVPAAAAVELQVGMPVHVPVGDQVLTGKLRLVSPEINPIDQKVRVWAEVENPDHLLRPGGATKLIIDK